MQVTCRLISQETFTVPAEPSTTVAELKKKIEEVKGENFKADLLKLIYAGKVLDNNDVTLESVKFIETSFVVVMVAKVKPSIKPTDSATQPAAVSSAPSSTSTTTTTTPATSAPATALVSTASSTTTQAGQPPAATQLHGAFGKTPAEITAMVDAICEMGYPRGEAEQALRASFYSPERAVEYLITGIPPGTSGGPSLSVPTSGGHANVSGQPQSGGAVQQNDPLANFRNSAQFATMRQMIQQDPALLPQFVESIGQSNPALLSAIRDNQEAFLAMLNNEEDMDDEEDMEGDDWQQNIAEALQAQGIDPAALGGLGNIGAALGGGGGGGQGGAAGPGAQYVNVTADEMAAIERLKALGFSEQVVIQAYLACEKNEEMAANLLFSGMDD